ncbi:MAG: pyridoxal phosphate-dependent aminotransferase [Deltaproteobacteria bacterium]
MSPPFVSSRLGNIPFAGIRKVFEKAAKLEAQGRKVIHFEIGRPDFDTPEHIKEAAKKALDKGFVHYTPNLGTLELRQALSESLMTYKNLTYDPLREIMVTAGGQEAMYLSLMALLEPGDEVLIPDPGYSQFASSVRLAQGVPVPYPLLLEQNSAPDLEAAEMLLSDRARAIIVNSPHNPTGAVLTPQQVEAVCGFAKSHDLLLFSDEAYDRVVFEGSRFVSPASFPGMKERTAVWGSLSKTYSMTGWRVGYLAAPAEQVAGAVKMQQNVLLSVCSFAQAGAVAALQGPQGCVDDMVAEFERRRQVILDRLSHAHGLSVPCDPRGAFYVFVRHDTPGRDSPALADYLLDHGGVAVVPGNTFGGNGDGCFRISFATSFEDCKEGMERIANCMKELLS